MIRVTRINGDEFVLNAELIKYIEETPDTIVTLRDGDKFLVRESSDEIVARAVEYFRLLRFVPEE